ncbi:MAG: tag [Microvirga sp.]|jgi:DNA-3-methyladenine glycosylase I|nr:tag [Microvirga sp.]
MAMTDGLILHPDNKTRCWWPGTDPFYVAYHDTEWGVPEFDDRALFEKLILDGFQAGLSWITILRKRENFRQAFAGFDPAIIARFDDAQIEALMLDPGIVRNRSKIIATIAGARAWLAIQERRGFSDYLWDHVDGRPVQNNLKSRADVRPETEISRRISKALKAEGFNFVGPTIVYAFMQAVGMVNDHLTGCFRHAECAAIAETL